MKTTTKKATQEIDNYLEKKSDQNYSGVIVLVVNMHLGGTSKVDIMGNRESLNLKSKDSYGN